MVLKEQDIRPFFSIGVTTYNRHKLLRETLNSVLSQDFTNFEVIVGNDYTEEVLTGDQLGISDPRVRFINHPHNLREVGNMNALLDAAHGRYFTWLFDDDLFEPGYLRSAHEVLVKEGFPHVVFPKYRILHEDASYQPVKVIPGETIQLTGRDFLRKYFSRNLNIISTTGFFDRVNFKKSIKGVEELCDSAIGLYCEYLLLVKCALLGKIVCLDDPYVVFRAHSDSWGASNAELHKYHQGGERLIIRCSEVLREIVLRQDFDRHLIGFCKIHLSNFCFVAMRVEAGSEAFGLSAVGRAFVRVMREISRVRKIFLNAGGEAGIRSRVSFAGMVGKCTYLVVFTFFYYGRRRRKRKAYCQVP